MKPARLILLALLPAATAFAVPPAGDASASAAKDATSHVMLDASNMTWDDPPPAVPRGAQVKVVSGDPTAPGGTFVIRVKAPAGYRIARHWHPTDEHVTVLEGTVRFDMGSGANAHATRFDVGDYVLMPARMEHEFAVETDAVIQVQGASPFEINYVDPKDDPRTKAGAE